jgi:DNA ligase-associated metallophosphoesterase
MLNDDALLSPASLKALPALEFLVAGIPVLADLAGALILEAESLLVVADLHLEKGSAYAARGVFLPPWDTAATLARLAELIARWRPRTVVALGDSFHDLRAGERMGADDLACLRAMQTRRDWIWVAGNHDPRPPDFVGGEWAPKVAIGGLILRHEPQLGACRGEIAGHLHPLARVVSRSGSVRRRCFVSDGERCVMPALGAFAGGLNVRDAAFELLFGPRRRTAHVLGRTGVYAISDLFCAPG